MSFLSLLAILLIGLKLTGHITISWWMATAPLWAIPVTLIIVPLALWTFAAFVSAWRDFIADVKRLRKK